MFLAILATLVKLSPVTHAGFFDALKKLFTASGDTLTNSSAPIRDELHQGFLSQLQSDEEGERLALALTSDGALLAPLIPFPDSGGLERQSIFLYEIEEDDTLAGIAKEFNVTVNTILWANDIRSASLIKPGDKLVILPVSGVKHEVKRGDTIESIARKYKGDIEEIVQYNGLPADGSLRPGGTIIIPDGEMERPTEFAKLLPIPDYRGYYIRPISGGRLSRGIHGWNAVDLTASCGEPIFAAADGTVIRADSQGWNSGYGQFLAISHSNGTQTLYAHASRLLASIGEVVKQGQVIALIGSTGNSTGCHVHFEVRGARNPFSR